MKKFLCFFLSIFIVLSFSGVAGADLIFSPAPGDLWDLEHQQYYTWGIDTSEITSKITDRSGIKTIELTFHEIYNWPAEESKLFVWLLDETTLGATELPDDGGASYDRNTTIFDEFLDFYDPADPDDGGFHLVTYETPDISDDPDIPYGLSNREDITYIFTESQIDIFYAYLSGSTIGFGFDPDCHYQNNGITLRLVPEPAVNLLLGTGLILLAGLSRKKFSK